MTENYNGNSSGGENRQATFHGILLGGFQNFPSLLMGSALVLIEFTWFSTVAAADSSADFQSQV